MSTIDMKMYDAVVARIAELEAEIARLTAALAEREATEHNFDARAIEIADQRAREEEREACAAWHDAQAAEDDLSIRSAKHPHDAQRMQDRYNTHVRSAATIRARP